MRTEEEQILQSVMPAGKPASAGEETVAAAASQTEPDIEEPEDEEHEGAPMRGTLSIVIPTLNAADKLTALFEEFEKPKAKQIISQVIVVDGGSTDDTAMIAHTKGAKVFETRRGRGLQLLTGGRAANSTWILFLHADSMPLAGWVAAVRFHTFVHGTKAGYFRFALDDDDGVWPRLVEAGVAMRCALFGLPFGDQGLLIPQRLYLAAGGHRPDHPIMEDVDLVSRLGKKRLAPMAAYVMTDASKYRSRFLGYPRRVINNQILLWRYMNGASPYQLLKQYW